MTDVTNTGDYYDFINNHMIKNPYVFLAIALVFVFYYFFIKHLGQRTDSLDLGETESTTSFTILKIIVAIVILVLITFTVLQYIYDVDIKVGLKNIFATIPTINVDVLNNLGKNILHKGEDIIDKEVELVENSLEKSEVFNI